MLGLGDVLRFRCGDESACAEEKHQMEACIQTRALTHTMKNTVQMNSILHMLQNVTRLSTVKNATMQKLSEEIACPVGAERLYGVYCEECYNSEIV